MIPSTDSERICNKEYSRGGTWIYMGRGNTLDCVRGLETYGHENRRDQAEKGVAWTKREQEERTGNGGSGRSMWRPSSVETPRNL